MQSVSFVLPSVDTAGMSRNDQGALIVNQATAVIVAAYLENAAALQQAIPAFNAAGVAADIVGLIKKVQDELKIF